MKAQMEGSDGAEDTGANREEEEDKKDGQLTMLLDCCFSHLSCRKGTRN